MILCSVTDGGPAAAGTPAKVTARTTGTGGVAVAVVAEPATARADAPVHVSIGATDAAARGALGYVVTYGDGATSRTAVPQFCLSATKHAGERWHLVHRFRRAGTYEVTVSVRAACSRGSATARLRIRVR